RPNAGARRLPKVFTFFQKHGVGLKNTVPGTITFLRIGVITRQPVRTFFIAYYLRQFRFQFSFTRELICFCIASICAKNFSQQLTSLLAVTLIAPSSENSSQTFGIFYQRKCMFIITGSI